MAKFKKYRWPKDWASLKKDFQRLFRMSFVDFYDGQMSWISGFYKIDLFKFDDRLHSQVGEYESRGFSMEDVVRSEYGSEAAGLLEVLL